MNCNDIMKNMKWQMILKFSEESPDNSKNPHDQ